MCEYIMNILNEKTIANCAKFDNVDDIMLNHIIVEFFDNHNDKIIDALNLHNHDLYNHFEFYFAIDDKFYKICTNVRYYDYIKNCDDFYDYKIDTLHTTINEINDNEYNVIKNEMFVIITNHETLIKLYDALCDNNVYDEYVNA